jgi:hypothetical protein
VHSRGRVYVVGACGALLAGLFIWTAFSGPMLIDRRLGPMRDEPRLAIWNPMRDRNPERAGYEYLRRVQSSNCEEVLAGLPIRIGEKATACAKQNRIPLKSACRLVERTDGKSGVWLLFKCEYQNTPGFLADVDVTLKQEKGAWILSSYERID